MFQEKKNSSFLNGPIWKVNWWKSCFEDILKKISYYRIGTAFTWKFLDKNFLLQGGSANTSKVMTGGFHCAKVSLVQIGLKKGSGK